MQRKGRRVRVELRVEIDEHEYAVLIECDQRVTVGVATATAQQAIYKLLSPGGVVVTEEMLR
jgi:hypothetical protein